MSKKKKVELVLISRYLFLITIVIALLELVALIKGVDGTMFGATMAGLGGIGGYLLKIFLSFPKK